MKKKKEDLNKINYQIKKANILEVRLTGDNVENGVYNIDDALKISADLELDLILISEKANPPVCKIQDYKKYLYDLKKKKKELDKKNKENQSKVKEIRFGPNTDDHDLNFKKNHAIEFLKNGDKVRAYVFFKGREIIYKEKGEILLLKLVEDISDYGLAESMPKFEGNKLIIMIKPKNKK